MSVGDVLASDAEADEHCQHEVSLDTELSSALGAPCSQGLVHVSEDAPRHGGQFRRLSSGIFTDE